MPDVDRTPHECGLMITHVVCPENFAGKKRFFVSTPNFLLTAAYPILADVWQPS
jgi:hypothetical protein